MKMTIRSSKRGNATEPQIAISFNIINAKTPILRIVHEDNTIQDIEIGYYDGLILASKLIEVIPFKKSNFDVKV